MTSTDFAPLSSSSVTLFAVLVLHGSTALGYSVRRTDSGEPVHWATSRVAVTLDPSLSLIGDEGRVEELVADALRTWQSADGLPLTLALSTAEVEVAVADHALDGRNTIFAIADDWPYDHRAPAVTIISYDDATGVIIEADIAIDATRKWSLTEDAEPRSHDFQDVITHELGHVLGLAHSDVVDATMFERYSLGSTRRRNLHDDDILAVLAAYDGVEIEDGATSYGCSAVGSVGASRARGCSFALLVVVVALFAAGVRSSERRGGNPVGGA